MRRTGEWKNENSRSFQQNYSIGLRHGSVVISCILIVWVVYVLIGDYGGGVILPPKNCSVSALRTNAAARAGRQDPVGVRSFPLFPKPSPARMGQGGCIEPGEMLLYEIDHNR
jgi:hypothetical protein